MNYADLKEAIGKFLGVRTDLASEAATFIAFAEADFNAHVRCREMEARATTTATEYLSFPPDYLELRDVQINVAGERVTLQMLSPSELDRRYSATPGEPKAYALIANEIQLAPPPDTDYEVEIVYYQVIPALSDVNLSNWLLAKTPNLYLYQSLFYAWTRAQDPQAAQQSAMVAKSLMDNLNGADQRQRWSGPPLQIRPG